MRARTHARRAGPRRRTHHPSTPPTPKGESPRPRPGREPSAEREKRHRERGDDRDQSLVAGGYVRYDTIRRAGSDRDVSAGSAGAGARKAARERDKTRRRPWTWRFPGWHGWIGSWIASPAAAGGVRWRARPRGECSADRHHMRPAARPCDPALRRAALPRPASGCRLVACRLRYALSAACLCFAHPDRSDSDVNRPAVRRGVGLWP